MLIVQGVFIVLSIKSVLCLISSKPTLEITRCVLVLSDACFPNLAPFFLCFEVPQSSLALECSLKVRRVARLMESRLADGLSAFLRGNRKTRMWPCRHMRVQAIQILLSKGTYGLRILKVLKRRGKIEK